MGHPITEDANVGAECFRDFTRGPRNCRWCISRAQNLVAEGPDDAAKGGVDSSRTVW